ncbi:hypothetical protein HOP62_04035 [Halomonas sp. MCCC 1A17488]|uniref:Transmembrane protein n=1 Tax=Billgrantia sulfidoxydans TaxID=2733484 RepID=A0ABX7W490_9GAMM|nr:MULTISPECIES: hypothetical protein [Halomonas]MCE8015242.1 hypothetical protein [Halomonas sp. MCCC 1A17488]MCG3238575.1 hypothetical protein [Halomonas sp. MCCC 1A17488]QPP51447.1 hypothetical protein I4484_10365 [Halomonas sp. SS10-MC5]QTP54995.1 hypothetical protein HNO51_10070 [Halomonas sulfidoxydans]
MPRVRHYADIVAILAGLMWIVFFWSISISARLDSVEPTLAAMLALGAMILVSFMHRPFRIHLSRYHVRKRRTEMWMHILALPMALALLFGVLIETLFAPMSGQQKMLLFNVLASAGWVVYVMTLVIKFAHHQWRRRRRRRRA